MSRATTLSKADARRALVRHHFSYCQDLGSVFEKLRSVQFDPISPVGCNHDLVIQARMPGYRVGDWNKAAYEDRLIYDGWDKQASLVPFEGWPLRRIFHRLQRHWFEEKIFENHKEAVRAVLEEIEARGPLMPKEFAFQQRKEEWKESWHGPSLTKQTLRALWHSGLIMTSGRKNGQHLYDLTERIVPQHLYSQPVLADRDAIRELIWERHRAMGLVRPSAPAEVWSYQALSPGRKETLAELVASGKLFPVEVEGVKAHATEAFLSELDEAPFERRVVFVAPLDPFIWDRKMIAHLFGFDYVWEIYTPEAKRRWGYYVLPVVFGDKIVARAEFFSRGNTLEVRQWHFEREDLDPTFWTELERSVRALMVYSSASKTVLKEHIDSKVRDLFSSCSQA